MIKDLLILILTSLAFFLQGVGTPAYAGSLVVFPAPPGAPHNKDYSVRVREKGSSWQDLHEYDAEVGRYKTYHTSYVYFDSDFSGKIELEITKNQGSVKDVRIRPGNIKYTREGNKITFILQRPSKLSVEFNGDIYNNLQIFANPLEVNPPKPDDPGVIYFGPGITDAGKIEVSSNQTVYLAGGSIVRGNININNASTVKVCGRGILDNSIHTENSRRIRMIQALNSSDVVIEGITIVDSHSWTIVPTGCDNVVIDNIKILNDVIYSDGIDVVSCQDVIINDVFIRNGDDCISIKARGTEKNSNINIKNSLFWSDGAHAILIGPEANGTVTEKLVFEKNHILEVNCQAGAEWWGTMGITNSGNQLIRDITFKDITVDDFTLSELFNIRIETNRYVSTPGRSVKNIRFINISYNGPNKNANLICGYDAGRIVDSIFFQNLRINGKRVKSAEAANLTTGQFAGNIFFK